MRGMKDGSKRGRQLLPSNVEGEHRAHRARRTFPTARLGGGAVAHYVDDYRYQPGRTLCGRTLSDSDEIGDDQDTPLCAVCARSSTGYPTETEFREYDACTDCGVDTWALGEATYTVRNKVWNTAYPNMPRG